MTRQILYLSHPEVNIDPQTPVPEWGISDLGHARIAAALAHGWPGSGWHIFTSAEVKARQTADMIAEAFMLPCDIRVQMGEVDRRSTGYVPHARHETLADALFATPEIGPEGWESAQSAQTRIVDDFEKVMAKTSGNILMVGHGAVGTFLWCHLMGTAITRAADQPRGGCVWAGTINEGVFCAAHPWRVVEEVAA